ncbi:MAG: single-stranded-DNA-specific exonuclease RecJ [Stellaceae bacterium]
MTDAGSFLGVERSLRGLRWRPRGGDDRLGLTLAQRQGVPELIGRILAARGIGIEEADAFLHPTLRRMLPDPLRLKDMDRAVARLVHAVEADETIAIFGDYDVDGATSAALLRRYLAAVGARTLIYIPDRQREGYGPNAPALMALQGQGARVVVTVDCGATAHAPLAAAARAGLDVIVVDHHVGEPALPEALAIINPNRLDEAGSLGMLAAVGVAFLLVVGLNRALREHGRFKDRVEPDLLDLLDLVALGTICDVVPLIGPNRALVTQGLKVLGRRCNPGLAALADVAGLDERLDAYHAGFMLGPRVNAGGRVGEAGLGARLLATDDAAEARELAGRLDVFNRERREIEAQVLDEAVALADRAADGAVILVAAEGWHPGVIGIVAGRLKDRYHRPALVVAWEGGIGKGSGRSVPGLPLGPAVIAARQAGLLLGGGGHAMAAGFSLTRDRVQDFSDFLEARFERPDQGASVPELGIDGALATEGATRDLAALVEQLGPFGTGNAEPRFVVMNARLVYVEPVKGGHLRLALADAAGTARLKAMAFRAGDGPLGPALMAARGMLVHVAGRLRENRWQGRSEVQLLVDDAALATGQGAI